MLSPEYQAILERIPTLPDTAVVPVEVVAAHDSVSARTVRRNYPLTQLSPRRCGVKVGYLRHRGEPKAA